jgi:hypothetical protein
VLKWLLKILQLNVNIKLWSPLQDKDWHTFRELFRNIRKAERVETQKSQWQRKEKAV